MADISSVSSSTDVSSKISYLVELSVQSQRKNLNLLYNQQSALNTKISKISSLRSNISSLKSTVSSFTSYFNVFKSYKAVSSDESVVSATATDEAITGLSSFTVNSIASSHKIASSGFSKESTNIFSAEGSGEKSFSVTVNGKSVNYYINVDDNDTDYNILLKIKDAINSNTSSKIRAGIIQKNDTDYALILESRETGVLNSINISDLTGNLIKNTGIVDSSGNILNTLSSASDAVISIGSGFEIRRSSNEIKDAIPGVVLNIKKTGSVNVNVVADEDAVISKLKDFVNSYNNTVSYIGKLLYEEKKTDDPSKGIFYSDPSLKIIRDRIRNILFEQVDNLNIFEAGFKSVDAKTVSKDQAYNISFDEASFKKVFKENPDGVINLLTSAEGVFKKLEDYINPLISSSGMMDAITNSATNNLSVISRRIDFSQRMLNKNIEYYKALYSTLSSKVSSLQNAGNAFLQISTKLF